MEDINDSLLVSINLSSQKEESKIEVVAYMGQHREVLNVFRGNDAELLYKTLINKHLMPDYVAKLPTLEGSLPEPEKEILPEILNLTTVSILGVRPENPFVIFNSEEDAKKVLDEMKELINLYSYATLEDLEELICIPTKDQSSSWGWTNLDGASIVNGCDSCEDFIIQFPDTQEIPLPYETLLIEETENTPNDQDLQVAEI